MKIEFVTNKFGRVFQILYDDLHTSNGLIFIERKICLKFVLKKEEL